MGSLIGGLTGGELGSFGNSFIQKAISSSGDKQLSQFINFNPQQYLLNSIFKQQSSDQILLKDINLQSSTYNKIIPEVFGSVRIAGNIIWSSPIYTEKIYHEAQFGKSFSAQGNYETKVYASFAIAICKAPISSLNAIYADDVLLDIGINNVSIYLGLDNQIIDSTIQSYFSIGSVPNFQNIVYAVFTNFNLANYNNRIPNFTFDVTNNLKTEDTVQSLVKAINIIPGSGEFVYDTIPQEKLNGEWVFGKFFTKSRSFINKFTSDNSNSVTSINNLLNTFPNLEWVSIVICWFGDNMNAGLCNVYPACEFQNGITNPDEWSVGNFNRNNARTVGIDKNGNIRYGGTPADISIVRFVQELKNRGLKVTIYPMLMMDVDGKPWRGRLKANSSADINAFFSKYNNFILHYANLLKDNADALIIGSEMVGLTSFQENNNYYAVDNLINLAQAIKGILKLNAIVTYAADWSEYHHDELGNYNLDKLWASNYIDVISIDAYFPLTNKNQSTYQELEIINGWNSGEGYDFYYEDSVNKLNSKPLKPEWAWKNIEYFWSNYHYKKDGTKTEWVPKSKKIWFTEYGFPSVDCCTNQPNVFYSPTSSESNFPHLSEGVIDFKAQSVAISGTEKKWLNSEIVDLKFLYCWEIRPYPAFPALTDVWADCSTWRFSHVVNGKIGTQDIQNVLNKLCIESGLELEEFDTSLIQNTITGYVVEQKSTALSAIKMLGLVYNFDICSQNGKLIFKKRTDCNINIIDEGEIILNKNNYTIESRTISKTKITDRIDILFLNIEKNYTVGTITAKRENSENKQPYSIKIPIAITKQEAINIGWRILQEMEENTEYYKIILPEKFSFLQTLDFIKIINTENNKDIYFQIEDIVFKNNLTIEVSGFSKIESNNYINLEKDTTKQINFETIKTIARTDFQILDIYNFSNECQNDGIYIYLPISSSDSNWKGASVYVSENDENNYKLVSNLTKLNTIGRVKSDTSQFNNKSSFFIDKQSLISVVSFGRNEYSNRNEDQFQQFKQLALIGNEIVAFKDYKQVDEHEFQISYFRRGLFNTENEIQNHGNGESFIILNDAINKIKLPFNYIDKTIFVKVVSFNQNINDVSSKFIKIQGNSIKNFNSLYLSKNINSNNDIILNWYPRNKIKKPSIINFQNRQFILTIYNKDIFIRKLNLNSNQYIYKNSDLIADYNNFNDANFVVEEKIIL